MGKRGPKLIPINWDEFDKLCHIQCSLREIASWFDCSEDTIENRVKQTHGIKFSEYFEQKRGRGKIALRRKQYDIAMRGDKTLLIWLGKQYLGQADKIEQKIDQVLDLSAATDEELSLKIAAIVGRLPSKNG